MRRHGQLGRADALPQGGGVLGTPVVTPGEALPLLGRERRQSRGCGVGPEEGPGPLGGEVRAELEGAGGVLLQRHRELVQEPGLLAHQAGVIPREQLQLLRGLRARLERVEVRVIRPEERGQDLGVEGIALGLTHPEPVPRPVQGLGVDRENHLYSAKTSARSRRQLFQAVLMMEPAKDRSHDNPRVAR